MSRDYTIRQFQTNLPWTIRYSNDFRSSSMAHKDFAHTLHHVSKAAGKLHALADDMDHDRALADQPGLREQYGKYIADLVVCALRLANVFPGGVIDLQRVVHERIEGKNGVTLPAPGAEQQSLHCAQRDAAYRAIDAVIDFSKELPNPHGTALTALLFQHGVHERKEPV